MMTTNNPIDPRLANMQEAFKCIDTALLDIGVGELTPKRPSRVDLTVDGDLDDVLGEICCRLEWDITRTHDGVQAAVAHIPTVPVPPRADVPGLHFLPAGDLYERTLILVDLSPEDFYVLDLFRVAGGNEHWWAFHGPAHDSFELRGAQLTPQEGGSAVGPDVPYGKPRAQDSDIQGLAWMYDVQRGSTDGPWSLDFALKGHPQVHVRTTVIPPDGAELILARGQSPRLGKPDAGSGTGTQFALLASRGEKPLRSEFVQVLEAYQGQSAVTEITPLRVSAVAGEAQWASGVRVQAGDRTDTLVFSRDPDESCRTDDGLTVTGTVGFSSEDNPE